MITYRKMLGRAGRSSVLLHDARRETLLPHAGDRIRIEDQIWRVEAVTLIPTSQMQEQDKLPYVLRADYIIDCVDTGMSSGYVQETYSL